MRGGVILVACAIAVSLPGAAQAATVTYSWGNIQDQSLRFVAASGEVNALVVSALPAPYDGAAPKIRLSDAGAPVTSSSPGCVAEDPHSVICDIAIAFSADLGDGDDTYISSAGRTADVSGGPGNDVLTGDRALASAAFAAQIGNEFSGVGESSRLDGGPGDDVLSGGADSDKLWGGPGDDRLSGNASFDFLCGGSRQPGDQCPSAGSGNDILDGGTYQDYLAGGDGNDHLIGGDGADSFSAGPGDDLIDATADSTPDTRGKTEEINAGSGNDRIFTRDGMPDSIFCNEGHDTVARDPGDFADNACTAPDGPPPLPPLVAPPAVRLDHARRTISVRVTCPSSMPLACAGSVKVSVAHGADRARLAGARYQPLAPGAARSVRLRVSRAVRVRLARRKPKNVTVRITNNRAPHGPAARAERIAKLR